ncbi:MAG: AAA family ATPase, partial [Candidatus Electrothrix sp. ATG1]|nr:AAA family ATPase [Candidatus Electrothrix sp. ATG1]
MKIPYGISNFKSLITEGYLYVDKTPFIATLEEQGKYNILLRPRRFGKTLFLSTLRHYYDIRCKEEFEPLFGNLAIGHNPTPLKNSYQILSFDFSGIETGSQEDIRRGFNRKVETALKKFLRRYGYGPETERIIEEQNSPAGKLDYFFTTTEEAHIYLLIDEYDHFANAILGESLELFTEIVGKGGFVRAFYEVIKTATMEGIVD